jgi:hypothetical protein
MLCHVVLCYQYTEIACLIAFWTPFSVFRVTHGYLTSVMSLSPHRQKQARVPSRDGRSADARLMRRTRAELIAHLGGKPSATQAAIIDQIGWLTLYVTRMNRQALETAGVHSAHAAKEFLAYQNSLTRALARLGLDATPALKQTHGEWLMSLAPHSDDQVATA